ncbi:MAG TPA: NUDIX domain-containing protein [Micromonosporaceae bacterium]|jgi:8-oxo-dGTP pyrophosphatase MutT (NUDIX family)
MPRRAARVLLIDAEGRVLLLRGFDPGRPGSRYWYTIGGGLQPGEDAAQGAARELLEETGLRVAPEQLGEPLFSDVAEFPYEGLWYRQRQDFYLLRVTAYDVPHDWVAGVGGDEHTIDEYRWWSVDDLAATDEKVYPPDLADTLRQILGQAECEGDRGESA